MTPLHRSAWPVLAFLAGACGTSRAPVLGQDAVAPRSGASDYLYLWATPRDSTLSDILAVLDVRERPGAATYGSLVTTLPVPGKAKFTHHTEAELAPDHRLFANDFGNGTTSIFDLSSPTAPRLLKQFGDVRGMMHPHTFWRLRSGNVLVTFQMQHDSLGMAPGGLAELTPDGEVVRTATADLPGVDRRARPYSAIPLPEIDRVLVTTTDMEGRDSTDALLLYRLSDLTYLRTIHLPAGPRGDEGFRTAEPRLLSDGRTLLVSTFNCGLYLMDGLAGDEPTARLVGSFPRKPKTSCAIPVVAGHYYLVTVPVWSAVVALDVSDPTRPFEVSRASFGPEDVPHWIAISPDHRRVVVTGYRDLAGRVEIVDFDERTGRLSRDERFRSPGSATPGFRLDSIAWPGGAASGAIPHGAVFSRP